MSISLNSKSAGQLSPCDLGLGLVQAGLHQHPLIYYDLLFVTPLITMGILFVMDLYIFSWELLGYLTHVLSILRQFYHELANSEKAFECLKKLHFVDSRYFGRSICISTIFLLRQIILELESDYLIAMLIFLWSVIWQLKLFYACYGIFSRFAKAYHLRGLLHHGMGEHR